MTLTLSPAHREAVARHARSCYPEECCGVLVGVAGEAGGRVERVLTAENVHPDRRRRRYRIAPAAVVAAQQEARARGLEVIGYYHSHPDRAPEPSAFDRRWAWPAMSYLIVEVGAGRVGALRSWRLSAGGGRFVEEPLALPTGVIGGVGGGAARPPGADPRSTCEEAAR